MGAPELVNLIINGGGFAVTVWLIQKLIMEMHNMRTEARQDRQQMWELLVYLVKADDSRTDIPMHLPSNSPRDE